MIIGHGVDIVETARIERMLGDHPERFLERVFTPGEQSDSNSTRQHEHLAARFAAKEAALKALGTGWSQGIGWTDIEVVRAENGKPSLKVTGRAAEIALRFASARRAAVSRQDAPLPLPRSLVVEYLLPGNKV